ncbi:MAG: hypothetical protein H7Y14_05425 [Burkholderiales bacterium]|nr:hypothetical protein [Burkholderiales bacterium]
MGSIIEAFSGSVALRAAPFPGTGTLRVRPARLEDCAAIRALQRQAHPGIPAWTLKQLDSQRRAFPDGQLVADCGGEVVGAASTLIVKWDHFLLDQVWKHVTGDGYFTPHDPAGRTLFGAELVVNLARRGTGAARSLYLAQRRLCRRLNLRRVIVAARMPGYRDREEAMSPENYAQRVVWGDIEDPNLRFAMTLGFQYCGVIRGYLPEDRDSGGNAALFVWLNPLYSPAEPPAIARPRKVA